MNIGAHPGVKIQGGKKVENQHDVKKASPGKKSDGDKKAAEAKKHIQNAHQDEAKAGKIKNAKKIQDGKKKEIKKVHEDKQVKHVKPANEHPVAKKVANKHQDIKKANVQSPVVKKLQGPAIKPSVDKAQAAHNIHIAKIVEVKDQKELDLILKVAKQWNKCAQEKAVSLKKLKAEEKLLVAEDAQYVAEGIQYLLEADKNAFIKVKPVYSAESIQAGKNAVFAAYDNRGKLQGVSLVSFEADNEWDNRLDEIMVNPERNQMIGNNSPIKGTGTQLMQAVASKILSKDPANKQNLGTFALLGAVSFYEKLGFEKICAGPGGQRDTDLMQLCPEKLKALALLKA